MEILDNTLDDIQCKLAKVCADLGFFEDYFENFDTDKTLKLEYGKEGAVAILKGDIERITKIVKQITEIRKSKCMDVDLDLKEFNNHGELEV